MSEPYNFEKSAAAAVPHIPKVNRVPPRRRRRLRHHDDGSVMTSQTQSTCSTTNTGRSSLSSSSSRHGSTSSKTIPSQRRQCCSTPPQQAPSITIQQEVVTTRGIPCICHVYYPPTPPRGIIVIFHGLNAHGTFPTISHLATLVSTQCSCIAYCLDFPGHGLSPGLRGHVTSAEDMVTDGMAVTLYAKKKSGNGGLPLFLAGQSLGGGVAALVAREFYVAGNSCDGSVRSMKEERRSSFEKARSLMLLNCQSLNCGGEQCAKRPSSQRNLLPQNIVAGLILLAPLVSLQVPKWQRSVLKTLATLTPRAALFPPAENASEAQFNDPSIRKIIEHDTLSYRGNLRVSSALACLKITKRVGVALQEMTGSTPLKQRNEKHHGKKNMPMLCVIGKNDMVVDNEALVDLLIPTNIPPGEDKENYMPTDVALREYDAKHGLLCELEPVRGWIESDIVTWLSYRILPEEEERLLEVDMAVKEFEPPVTLEVDRLKLRQLPTKGGGGGAAAAATNLVEEQKRNLYEDHAARHAFQHAVAATERLHQSSSTPQTASPSSSYSEDIVVESPPRVSRRVKRFSLPEDGDGRRRSPMVERTRSMPVVVTPPRRAVSRQSIPQRQRSFHYEENVGQQMYQQHPAMRTRSMPEEVPLSHQQQQQQQQQRPYPPHRQRSRTRLSHSSYQSQSQHYGDGGRYQARYSLDGLEETQML